MTSSPAPPAAPDSRPQPLRVVLDTNLLVGSAYAPHSASRRILEGCLRGDLLPVVSAALRREYEWILPRAVRGREQQAMLRDVLERALCVEPAEVPRVVRDDPGDDKLLAVALAAGADALITSDRHLLSLAPQGRLAILKPADFLRRWLAGAREP